MVQLAVLQKPTNNEHDDSDGKGVDIGSQTFDFVTPNIDPQSS